MDDEEEKEDLGDEDEAEEYEEEDNLAGSMDEERSDTNDQGVLQEGSVSLEELEADEAHSADTQEVVEDSLRQRKSQHANKGPQVSWCHLWKYRPETYICFPLVCTLSQILSF